MGSCLRCREQDSPSRSFIPRHRRRRAAGIDRDRPRARGAGALEDAPNDVILKSLMVHKSNIEPYETPVTKRTCSTLDTVAKK